ncbi:hypothetical protein TRFO_34786 [Tritrichomonas foetus]|uniref:Protein kinase domain-containing protein n=1 Tax=Tritrichomonas foetus TaxID=1144522 RepID=A0A1J4JJU4_9EUKA|nr:hypothetical protein TRFO_34786 [Tritrichomonas foetus]|eukprot:OHS98881.1 hypothetical protein TRFO_34786 [Tritrichomonas foetus]
MMLGQPYTTSADLWSAAVCLYAMAVGRLPFEDTNIQRLIEKVTDEEPNYPDSLSEHLSTLLQMMLKKQQIQRADITKIRINPWFHSYYLSDKMRYDFGVENGWRNPPMGEFVEDKSILYDIQKYQDPVKLVELLKAKTYNSTTALYRIVKREKTTHEMKGMKANAHNLVNISPIPTISAAASAQQDVKNMIMKMKQRNPRSYNESSTPVKRRRRTELGHEANSDFLTLPMNPQNTRAQVAAQILVRKNPAGSARNNPNKNSALVSDE